MLRGMTDASNHDKFEPMNSERRPADDVDAVLAEGKSLGGFDIWRAGRERGMSDQKIRMAAGLIRGMTKTDALRAAGYVGSEGAALRSAASKAARSKQMQELLADAEKHKAGLPGRPLSDEEKLGELARLARSSNPQLRIRAIEAHSQLQEDLGLRSKQNFSPDRFDPVLTLLEIAALSPLCAQLADELARLNELEQEFASAKARGRQPARAGG
jgi:hypothetical protein